MLLRATSDSLDPDTIHALSDPPGAGSRRAPAGFGPLGGGAEIEPSPEAAILTNKTQIDWGKGLRLTLERICLRQLIRMSDDHLPGVALKPVDLGAAQHTVIRAPIAGPLHVLKIDRASQIFADHSENVLDPAVAPADPGARPIQAPSDIVPAALKSPESHP